MGSAEKPGSEEKYPKGMSLFLDALIKETVSLTNRPQDEEIILKSMSAHLAGIPDTTQRPKLTKEESFVFELFDIFGELFQSYEMVFRVGEIASLPFPESSTITELQFLEFIADGALNEFYIFEERLKHFIERLAILYRGDLQASAFRTWERTTKRTLYQFVSTPVIVRNKHVHRRRLLANDDQFKRAGTLEMLVKQGKMEKMKHLYLNALADVRKAALERLDLLTKYARHAASIVFDDLSARLLDSAKRLRYPSNLKAPKG